MVRAARCRKASRIVTMLAVDIEKTFGDFRLKARFTSEAGATALFGPSGAGKTSIINMIAGLLEPERGRITLGDVHGDAHGDADAVLFDAENRVNIPPWRRRIGYVFQEGRLFPHLSVAHNLDYGRWVSGLAGDPREFSHVVEMLDIGHLLERRPGKLSGGERQRVAVGRALLMRPRLLLLDEPLASLDAARKRDIMPYLERLRDEARVPMIYVSHNAAEVRRIARRVVRIEDGEVTATGGVDLLDETQADMLA
jgi:molybdate transport system ATP-binding protein